MAADGQGSDLAASAWSLWECCRTWTARSATADTQTQYRPTNTILSGVGCMHSFISNSIVCRTLWENLYLTRVHASTLSPYVIHVKHMFNVYVKFWRKNDLISILVKTKLKTMTASNWQERAGLMQRARGARKHRWRATGVTTNAARTLISQHSTSVVRWKTIILFASKPMIRHIF